MKAGSTINKSCSCKSEYQDAEYGKGMRVHNVPVDKASRIPTCTVRVPSREMARVNAHGRQHNKQIHG